jgi:hypothetical protein
MWMKRVLLFVMALWLLAAPAFAIPNRPIVIHNSPGGYVTVFADKVKRSRNRPVIIDGLCTSSCTLFLGHPKVCATPNARIGFHQAWNTVADPVLVNTPVWWHTQTYMTIQNEKIVDANKGTNIMWSFYPQPVRDWIARNGGMPNVSEGRPGAPLWLEGNDLQWIVPMCHSEVAP